jgi:hypothetical protein
MGVAVPAPTPLPLPLPGPVGVTPPAVPTVPVKTEPAVAPPARAVSRSKPADGPMPPTEKSVFVPPEKKDAVSEKAATEPEKAVTVAPVPVTPPPAPKVPAIPVTIERHTPSNPDIRVPTPGDDPMTLKQSALAAALGGALAVAPSAPAAFPVPPVAVAPVLTPPAPTVPVKADPTVDERVKAVEKKVDDLIEALKGKKDRDGFVVPTDPGLIEEVKRLKNEIASLKAQLDKMEKSTTSLRPSTGGTTAPTPADPLAGKGTVRVVNDYPIEITMVVNNNSYRIAPNTKLEIPVPVGTFTYQLLSAGANLAPTTSALKEKEVVTLRIK